MIRFKYVSCLLLIFLFSSCPSPTTDSSSELPIDHEPPVLEKEDFFISNGNTRIFSTNTYEFGTGFGATYWIEESGSTESFNPFSISVKKLSGHTLGGFGVFFAQRNIGSAEFSALTVLINCQGEYCIGLIENQSFSYISQWTDCSFLIQGYNQINVISISGDVPGEYWISFNQNDVYQFKDSSEPLHSGGGFGYLAVVSPLENFPSVPVSIEFEKHP